MFVKILAELEIIFVHAHFHIKTIHDPSIEDDTQIITNVIKEFLYLKHSVKVSMELVLLNLSEIDYFEFLDF